MSFGGDLNSSVWCEDVTSDRGALTTLRMLPKAFNYFCLEKETVFFIKNAFPQQVLWGNYSDNLMQEACPGDSALV